jgi:hypothetical protein
MLEPKTLSQTPVPDPTIVSSGDMRHLLSLVDQRLMTSGKTALDLEKQIDNLVAELYSLSVQECQVLGIRD